MPLPLKDVLSKLYEPREGEELPADLVNMANGLAALHKKLDHKPGVENIAVTACFIYGLYLREDGSLLSPPA